MPAPYSVRTPGATSDPFTRLAAAVGAGDHDLISTDLFDTVLLRDASTETERLAAAARRAAPVVGVGAEALVRLRWALQESAYGAVALERPEGEARLEAMCAAMAAALGGGHAEAEVLRAAEVAVDIGHLRAHRRLLALLGGAREGGTRVVAVSDTYYGAADLRTILDAVVGPPVPLDAVYSSADVGLTKHAGGLFDEVARREGVPGHRVLHVGDHSDADVARARAASWSAVHLPRPAAYRARRLAGRVRALPVLWRRVA